MADRINWSKALTRYLYDTSLSYADIAREFNVTQKTVAIRAGKENWPQLRKETTSKVHQNLPEKVAEEITEANKQDIEVGKMLISKGLTSIQKKELDPANWSEAKESIKDGITVRRKALNLDQPQAVAAVQIVITNTKVTEWGK